MIQEPNNEQKLTYIYNTLKDQESRRIRAIWYKFSKWTIYIGIIYLVVTNASLIIGEMTKIIQPIVMNQMKVLLDKNKDNLMEGLKDLIPVQEPITITIPESTPTPKTTPASTPKKPVTK